MDSLNVAIMGKKRSKRSTQSRVVSQPGDAQPQCPYCGITQTEKSAVSLMDQLIRSHSELCATLRLAGRQILQSGTQGNRPLDEIRKVLKRADNIRKALKHPSELPEASNASAEDEIVVDAPMLAAEFSPEQLVNEGPVRKRVQRKTRLARPRSLRLIRFPTA